MSKSAFLKQFITEEVYVIDKQNNAAQDNVKVADIVKEPEVQYPEEQIAGEAIPINYKGANKKGIAIIVNYPDHEYISADDEAFLLKILSAVKLSAEDVGIINRATNNNLIPLKALESTTCLIFDEKSDLTNGLNPYSITSKDGIDVLWGSPLTTIAIDKVQKKLLWEALQSLFLK
ncbi:MAG TPA: hypothetical protein PKL31_11560 [Fulvivirga sp.]|nr:hypothetical protein [Fulvivirga sp.]